MQTTKNMTFHACILLVQVLIWYVNTRLQCIFNRFCWKVPVWVLFLIRAMYWDTSKDVWQCGNLGFFCSMYSDWVSIDNVVFRNILRSIKAALLELEKAMFTGANPVPMFTIITPGPYTHSKQSKAFHAKCNWKVNCEKIGFDNQKWLYEYYKSPSNSEIYMSCSWGLF